MSRLIFRKKFEGLEVIIQEKLGFASLNTHFRNHYQRGYWLVTMKMNEEHPFSAPRRYQCKLVRPTEHRTPLTRVLLPGLYYEIESHCVVMDIVYDISRHENKSYDRLRFKLRSLIDGELSGFGILLPYATKQHLLPPPHNDQAAP